MPRSIHHSERRKNKKIKKQIRISFIIYACLLLILVVNFFFIKNKEFISYEFYAVGIAYLTNLTLIFSSPRQMRQKETIVYLTSHILIPLVFFGIHFLNSPLDLEEGMAAPRYEVLFED